MILPHSCIPEPLLRRKPENHMLITPIRTLHLLQVWVRYWPITSAKRWMFSSYHRTLVWIELSFHMCERFTIQLTIKNRQWWPITNLLFFSVNSKASIMLRSLSFSCISLLGDVGGCRKYAQTAYSRVLAKRYIRMTTKLIPLQNHQLRSPR